MRPTISTAIPTLSVLALLFALFPTQPVTQVSASPITNPLQEIHLLTIRDTPPATKQKPPTVARPNKTRTCTTGSGTCSNDTDKEEYDEPSGDDGPAVTDEPVPGDKDFDYRSHGAAEKTKKRDRDPPQKCTDQTISTNCAGEWCVNEVVEACPAVPMVCTHMAGRMWLARWWTCCPAGQYAAWDGRCCDRLTSDWKCAS